MLDWMCEFVSAVVVASVVRIAEMALPNPEVQLLRRVRFAAVEGMMLVLLMAVFWKRGCQGENMG